MLLIRTEGEKSGRAPGRKSAVRGSPLSYEHEQVGDVDRGMGPAGLPGEEAQVVEGLEGRGKDTPPGEGECPPVEHVMSGIETLQNEPTPRAEARGFRTC